MKKVDLTGQTINWIHVESLDSVVTIGKNTKRSLWLCTCKCGKSFKATTQDILTNKVVSCGCKHAYNGTLKRKNEEGKIYNYLKVEECLGSKNNRTVFRCTCLRCGNTTEATGKALRKGTKQSCGCLKYDYMKHFGNTNFNDLTGKQFGYLLVKSRADTKYSKSGNQTTMWNCICLLCGNQKIVSAGALTTSNHTRSCGCLKMSYAEHDIQNELKRLNIKYIFDYSFYDLKSPKSNNCLRFDFALFDNNVLLALIEYQGQQHYQKYKDGFGDFQREVTDPIKKEYCKNKNIPLYEIKYDENTIVALHNILNKVYNTSYDNPVPSSEQEKV